MPIIAGYSKTYRKYRPNGGGGGLIMLIRDGIKTKNLNINIHQRSIVEAQAVEITIARNNIKLLHVYNPETTLDIRDFKLIAEQIGRKYLIVGDMNGHHSLWDPYIQSNNQCGNVLADFMLDQPTLALATPPGLPTFTNYKGETSTLDLTFCSPNLIHLINVSSLADHGSDHLPILTKVDLTPEKLT